MPSTYRNCAAAALTILACPAVLAAQPAHAPAVPSADLTVSFEENRGQLAEGFWFMAHAAGYDVFLDSTGLVIRAPGVCGAPATAMVRFAGARALQPSGRQQLPGVVNYLYGNDPGRWVTRVPTYGQVRYEQLYPGIDLLVYGAGGRVEFDWIVAPGARLEDVVLELEGAPAVLDEDGDLMLSLPGGELELQAPCAHQHGRPVAVSYTQRPHDHEDCSTRVGLAVGEHDAASSLVIDPVLVFSSYLGDPGRNIVYDVDLDPAGNVVIAGQGSNFSALPITPTTIGSWDGAFVIKLDPTGSSVLYATYFGSNNGGEVHALAVTPAGHVWIGGYTTASNFPLVNPLQTYRANGDAFLSLLDASGTFFRFSTYLGGTERDDITALALGPGGDVHVAGMTCSSAFPTVNAAQPVHAGFMDGFLAKVDAAGTALLYSTFLGGSGEEYLWGLDVDSQGHAAVVGYTDSRNFPTVNARQSASPVPLSRFSGYITKLDPSGAFAFSTYFSGDLGEPLYTVTFDPRDNLYVAGTSGSSNFPLVNPLQGTRGGFADAFITQFDPTGMNILYSTWFGGSDDLEAITGVSLDSGENLYVSGWTDSDVGLPLLDEVQSTYGGHIRDGFAAKISAGGGQLVWSTYLGGDGEDDLKASAVVDGRGLWVVGSTRSTNFPTASPLQATIGGSLNGFMSLLLELEIYIHTVTATASTVLPGQNGLQVSFNVENATGAPVQVTSAALTFADAAGADVSAEYSVTPAAGNPTTISAGATATFDFLVNVSAVATLGSIGIDGQVSVTDPVSLAVYSDDAADTTDSWVVLGCATTLCGDCTLDGVVNILDALIAAQFAAGLLGLSGVAFSNCNVTGPVAPNPAAAVNILDALTIGQFAASLPATMVCC